MHLRRKPTTKKHKTWDGDGLLSVSSGIAVLRDTASGKDLGRLPLNRPLLVGSTLSMAGRELEVDEVLKEKPKQITNTSDTTVKSTASITQAPTPRPAHPAPLRKVNMNNSFHKAIERQKEGQAKALNAPAPRSLATQSAFKKP